MAKVSVRHIKARIKTIKNIQKMTRSMMLVAAAKFAKAQIKTEHARPYAHRLKEIMQDIALRASKNHPYLIEREVKNELAVIITSNRGLCGSFNTNLILCAEKYINEVSSNINLLLVGKRGIFHFRKKGFPIISEYIFPEKDIEGVSYEIANKAEKGFLSCEFDRVVLIYNEFVSVFRQKSTVYKLIPVTPKEPEKRFISDYIYEPDPITCLEAIFSLYFKYEIYEVFLESIASENAARMLAMDNATKNAEGLAKELFFTFNQARQAGVTKEITEIVTTGEVL
ncbi:TPA: ATP synthase F1 subunit gamma [bacterium]|nr:ATP synthase F1 subunit gamma [bacterium]